MAEIDDAVDGRVDGLKTVVDTDDVREPLQKKISIIAFYRLGQMIWSKSVTVIWFKARANFRDCLKIMLAIKMVEIDHLALLI